MKICKLLSVNITYNLYCKLYAWYGICKITYTSKSLPFTTGVLQMTET